ncbi:gp53-like domain-containing protein [Stutzerimonas stutzeri]|uniref:gp53-like domain-containing protein n=1 Tax=Stutzerimonas stutzeri TaxID=316 RepID=UPI002658E36D|nr:hypothetical protein [Stutzerimonas stutzeri]MCF6782314.1 hypothetical protein [Stutzerimonas stutzeri]MCF6805364.1 hypothetical protein [Stutzerimonas stutzeri]
MARSDSFQKKWASVPSQFERPTDALIDRGWAGGAAEDPPEAKWENWWHNRVDEALAEIEANGALAWFADVSYGVGATVHQGGKNWIAAIANSGIDPVSGDNVGHWIELGAGATEAVAGPSKVATQAQTNAGTDDATIVTPKKLRWGFQHSLAANGYIIFPSWLAGLVIQWGTPSGASTGASGVDAVSFPIEFPTAAFVVIPVDSASNVTTLNVLGAGALSKTGFTAYWRVDSGSSAPGVGLFYYLAIGH